MPNVISFTRKGDVTGKLIHFNTIDEEICKHFNVPVSETRYVNGWYDTIGYSMKGTLAEIADMYRKPESVESEGSKNFRLNTVMIMEYLDEHFVLNAGYSPN